MPRPSFSSPTPVFSVSDVPRSLEHYEQVLGFEVAWKWSEVDEFAEPAEPTFACVKRGECCIFLCEDGQGNPGAWLFVTVCDREQFDALFSEYRAVQADFAQLPTDCSWGLREMHVRDLDGNVLRIGCQIEA